MTTPSTQPLLYWFQARNRLAQAIAVVAAVRLCVCVYVCTGILRIHVIHLSNVCMWHGMRNKKILI